MPAIPHTAMIFAAGYGTRMRPLTDALPKPLVPVLGKPLIDYRLDKLAEIGVKRVVVNTHYKAEMLEAHLARRKDMEIIISREETLLETGGGLVKALPWLGDRPIYLLNADMIWMDNETPALIRLAEQWDDSTMDELLLLQPRERALGYHGTGDFGLDAASHLQRKDTPPYPFVFTGIQIFHPKRLAAFSVEPFSRNILWKNAWREENGTFERLYGLPHIGEWLHIDSVENLKDAEAYLTAQTSRDSCLSTRLK